MIRLSVVEGDLLASQAESIMLPIDGLLPANSGLALVQRSLGRIARAFSHRYPEAGLIDEMDAQVSFPLPLGCATPVELSTGSPFKFALLLSMLPHHADETNSETVRAATSSAFTQALRLCDTLSIGTVAAPLLKAGWRVSTAAAMTLILKSIAGAEVRHPLAVEIRILGEPGAAAQMREQARSFGIDAS
jgi:hypothetical protein